MAPSEATISGYNESDVIGLVPGGADVSIE